MCANPKVVEPELKSLCSVQGEGQQTTACAPGNANVNELTGSGEDAIIKKRKTRRGKSKRRNPNPYTKLSWQQRKNIYNRQGGPYNRNKFNRSNMLNHALAPFNSNQFLMEDHGDLKGLDDKLNKSDGAGTSMANPSRTRDSSFSVDSDADFYSSPEDEEEFLTKEFDTAYENLQAERLQSISKADLIEEYLQLENKVEMLTKRLRGKSTTIGNSEMTDSVNVESTFQQEMNKLIIENNELRRENEHLRNGIRLRTTSSFSSTMDSESDSSSSTCNSSSASSNEAVVMKEDPVEVIENGMDGESVRAPTPTPSNNDHSPLLNDQHHQSNDTLE